MDPIKLQAALFERFLSFEARVKAHRMGHHNYDWLSIHSQPFIFQPDYLQLHQFGKTPFKTVSNRLLSHSFTLWSKVAWPQIKHTIITLLQHRYIPLLDTQSDITHKARACVHSVLSLPFKDLPYATFTDLYYFLNESLYCMADALGTHSDLFKQYKRTHAEHCLRLYPTCKDDILSHKNAFEIAVFLALRANWIDCVDQHADAFLPGFSDEISEVLDDQTVIMSHILHNPYFHIKALKKKLNTSPQTILYECDNHGEIFFDLIFVEWLLQHGHRVHLACKFQPALNDVTYAELEDVLTHAASLQPYLTSGQLTYLHTGSTISGKYMSAVSEAYKKAYQDATLLILKGQGNFQTMPMGKKIKGQFVPYPYAKPIVFMMGMKAPFIRACFSSIIKNSPEPKLQMPFLYIFDSQDEKTFPR
jgi:uncharacterized protein with ATP-grasp and redox domains